MKTLQQIFDIIEENEISIDNYTEGDKLCGYELTTYTQQGVNQIIFLDFRNNGDPKKVYDFIEKFKSRIAEIDIAEEIELNRQDKRYRENFTLRQSLKDFEDWKKKLGKILKQMKS